MASTSIFKNLATVKENPNMLTFRLTPTNVAYANTLRRTILTGVESVAFRSDMNETGKTSDVIVLENTTPMTNEMLADRIGLIPIHADPLTWKKDQYVFELEVENNTSNTLPVKAEDFAVIKQGAVIKQDGGAEKNLENEENNNFGNEANNTENNNYENTMKRTFDNNTVKEVEVKENNVKVGNKQFFHPDPITNDTCLIALLKGKQPAQKTGQKIKLQAVASVGTGRDHIRFSPVCQCSYAYSIDTDESRLKAQFEKWIQAAKNKTPKDLEENKPLEEALKREFETMEVQRCFKQDLETGEPNSFDFVVESVGVQTVERIVERALENLEAKCTLYSALDKELPSTVKVRPADARMKGYDILFQKEDHTLGNLLQTYMDENMMGKDITFVGYKVPHPLRDEMVLRVGVDFPNDIEKDGKEITALQAVAKAAMECRRIFSEWREQWTRTVSQGKGVRSLASLRPTAQNAKAVEQASNLAEQVIAKSQQGGRRVTVRTKA